MIDTALLEKESKGQPIRVGMVGAGAEGRAIALQLGSPVPGIRLVGIANRSLENGRKGFFSGRNCRMASLLFSCGSGEDHRHREPGAHR